MSNFFTLLITLLITISASSQHLETSFNIINYNGKYSAQKNINSFENGKSNISLNQYQIGLKARYLKRNNTIYEIALESVFGSSEFRSYNVDQSGFTIRTKPQPTVLIMFATGKIMKIKKIRFIPTLKIGIYSISPDITQSEKHFSNNSLIRTEVSEGHRVNGVLIGPNIGVDYEILKRFYFGVSLDFFLNIRENIGTNKRIITHYNTDGSEESQSFVNTEFDDLDINLGGLQISWSFTYRLF